MWLNNFLNVISPSPSPSILSRGAALARLNPDKIYIENVRALLDVSHKEAVTVCEAAVRQGLFSRGVEVLCPNDSVATTAASEENLPTTVICWQLEDGDYEEIELPTAQLRKVTFYRLNEQPSASI